MKVFYTYDIFSDQKYGGISRYFMEMIKKIPPDKANIRIFAGLHINEYINQMPLKSGIKVPQWKNTGFIRRNLNTFSQKIALLGTGDETIVHQTYYYPFTPPRKSKYVITVHDMIHELFPEHFSPRNRESRWKRQCCDRADKIISVSNSTKADLVRLFGIDPEKIEVIHHGSPLDDAPTLSENIQFGEVINREVSNPYILYVGIRKAHKNFVRLLQAFSRSKKLQNNFHLLCFGGGLFIEQEKKLFNELGVSKYIHHLSGNDALLAACYRQATAFIYPSLYEGFGIPLVEAMNWSCPVICSNTSSVPEIVGDAGIFFDPTKISSIQNALEETLFDERLLEMLKEKGLLRKSLFSWDRCANETLSLYRSLSNS